MTGGWVPEDALDEGAHRVALAGGDDVVVGLVLLQHEVYGADVVLGVAQSRSLSRLPSRGGGGGGAGVGADVGGRRVGFDQRLRLRWRTSLGTGRVRTDPAAS